MTQMRMTTITITMTRMIRTIRIIKTISHMIRMHHTTRMRRTTPTILTPRTTLTHLIIPVYKRRTLEIDLNAFSLDSVKRAAYRFADRFSVELAVSGTTATCTAIFESNKPDDWIDSVVDMFRKELLDQDLRQSIRKETKDVRNLILAHVFSKTGLIEDESVPPA